jgi:hypothetical protein
MRLKDRNANKKTNTSLIFISNVKQKGASNEAPDKVLCFNDIPFLIY